MQHMGARSTKEISTSKPRGIRLGASWIASAPPSVQSEFLDSLVESELKALPFLFEFWALEHQLPPDGDWRSWLIMGGRGAGKTRAGAEWVRSLVEGAGPSDPGKARRIALVGETFDQAREVMVFGESGILAVCPPDRKPEWIAGRKMLVWPNGATAQVLSAHDPDALRGLQFDGLWADELAKWRKAEEAWDMLQFGLRLGDDPRACVTTTPRNVKVLTDLLERDSTVVTHAPTSANRANLASGFLEEVQRRYAGTRLGRQELDGVLLADAEGALWTSAGLEAARVAKVPELSRIVVAVDPSAAAKGVGDACGIVVVGAVTEGPPQDWRAYVLEDATVHGASPLEWAKAAVDAFRRHGADRMVAEVNQGGAMVEAVVRQVEPLVPFRSVHAARGKVARAEPAAALYEQGRVRHAAAMSNLEDQMCQMTHLGYLGSGSPDRVDALVWALHELMIEPAGKWRQPRLRVL